MFVKYDLSLQQSAPVETRVAVVKSVHVIDYQ